MRNDLLLVQTAFQFHSPQFSKFHQETFKLCFIVIIIFFFVNEWNTVNQIENVLLLDI